ncbi:MULTISPECIES: hypothetical protein [Streptomyces]|uniref:hypothetical protein n=1 Tax=Streptomyces TaxID=1883 RepID=UPI000CF2EA72|nr:MULTISPECIES: hypothetical protein [Streptomyces]PPS69859.1 hypothetical protein BV882_26255 [Streptomyces sp. 46]
MRRSWFHLFADCLLLGVLLLVRSLPVGTAFPSFVAGCSVLREQARGGPGVTPATLLAALRRALRSAPVALCLVPAGVLALLWLDAVVLDAYVPGMAVPVAVAGAVVAATGLRCAAGWREGVSWRVVAGAAFRSMPQRPLVPLLLAGAAVAAAVLPAMSVVVLLVVLGPLALAATAVDAWRPMALSAGGPDPTSSRSTPSPLSVSPPPPAELSSN